MKKNCDERVVYIPEGKWIDFWSNKEVEGQVETSSDAPLERLPLYFEAHDGELAAAIRKARKEVFNLENDG
ncbi:MAG: hypothetical protein FGF53_04575 [Candidatus Brockarchaeota archaeon]|nr:hypothetical protein [Candidatus Brockarchaeota archaeon]MBO3808980.1 hypothetical protein [Candidatus Brockarchaeota archaeon]MBO3842424.1 hypothetical protein [Candidatus Brockarchaeota archaeon]